MVQLESVKKNCTPLCSTLRSGRSASRSPKSPAKFKVVWKMTEIRVRLRIWRKKGKLRIGLIEKLVRKLSSFREIEEKQGEEGTL